MWRLILILALAATEIESWQEMGCEFIQDTAIQYRLPAIKGRRSTFMHYKEELAANFTVRFGDKVTPMKFADMKKVQELIKTIQPMFADIMEHYLVSDIPEFIRFYDKWEESYQKKSNNYEIFLREYIPSSPMSNLVYPAYYFAIKILTKIYNIEKKYGKVEENCFLVAVYEDIVVTGDNINPQVDPSHVAAAIQIKIGTMSGVILMDMGDNAFGPVVLMDHSSVSSSASSKGGSRTNSMKNSIKSKASSLKGKSNPSPTSESSKVNTYAEEKYDFRLEKRGDKTYVIMNKKGETTKGNIYDISAPYCSFLTTTFKRQFLMKTSKSIFARDRDGNRTASITFDLIEENPKFTMTIYNTDGPETTKIIGFKDLYSMDSTQKKHYDKVLNKFSYGHRNSYFHIDVIKDTIIRVVEIFEDSAFITAFKTKNMAAVGNGNEVNTKTINS